MTLVIEPGAMPSRLLWAHMSPVDLTIAREALRDRENIHAGTQLAITRIGSWQLGDIAPANIPELPVWAQARGLDAAVWTSLEPRFPRRQIAVYRRGDRISPRAPWSDTRACQAVHRAGASTDRHRLSAPDRSSNGMVLQGQPMTEVPSGG